MLSMDVKCHLFINSRRAQNGTEIQVIAGVFHFNSVSQSCVAVQQLCSPWLRHSCQKSHKPQLTCFVLQPFPQLEIASSDCSIPVLTIFLGLWLISLFRACRIIHIKITPSSGAWFERLEVWGFYCRGLCMFQDVGLGSFFWWGTQWQPGDFPDLFGTF